MPSAFPLNGLRIDPCGDFPTAESMSCRASSVWPAFGREGSALRDRRKVSAFQCPRDGGRAIQDSRPSWSATNQPDPASRSPLQPATGVHMPQRGARLARVLYSGARLAWRPAGPALRGRPAGRRGARLSPGAMHFHCGVIEGVFGGGEDARVRFAAGCYAAASPASNEPVERAVSCLRVDGCLVRHACRRSQH